MTEDREGSFGLRFVIQQHFARTHHFDFRLEKDGVFKGWAVPKGIATELGVKRLAVEVEDHPLRWGMFEGEIPPGHYGEGTVQIWDRGTYEARHWESNRIDFVLHGARLQGGYELVRFKRAGEHVWLIFKLPD
ncbi:MAG: ATP-dependent DNA ligase [Deltaproteobacteria bacterium]|nr:ATP-dependent DNA ligase [Deltaproteobacteria bacterium]